MIDYDNLISQQNKYLTDLLFLKKKSIVLYILSKNFRQIRKEYSNRKPLKEKQEEFEELYKLTNRLDTDVWLRRINRVNNYIKDFKFLRQNRNAKNKIKKSLGGNVCIVTVFKNEARYLDEWIAYHLCIGVDHLFLFNNGSTDDFNSIIKKYEKTGSVTLLDYPGKLAQLPAFRVASRALKGKYQWAAFIDADEFILPKTGKISEVLKKYDSFDALGVNWTTFGPSGHEERPQGLVIENYTETFADVNNIINHRVKVIAKPQKIIDFTSPHFCILKDQQYAKDENSNVIDTKWMYISHSGPAFVGEYCSDVIRINHYWTKSLQDVKEKCQRGYACGDFNPDYNNIIKRVSFPMRQDFAIQEYIPKVKEYLNSISKVSES